MKINVYEGKWDKTCTTESNLTENHAKKPAIRDVIQYAEPRMLSTLIVSGAKSPWDLQEGSNALKTKIGEIPKSQLIGDNAYRYNVMGRIQQKSFIIAQVGTSGADGTFSLRTKDDYLFPGMIALFYTGLQARVNGRPTGSPGNWTYNFQTVDGTVFVFATHVTPQPGDKTCFGATTGYGEKSLRGYGRTHYAGQYINHLTTQRSTISISGDAMTDVLWYDFAGVKGWIYAKEKQQRLQFMMQDEFQKWKGQSTMRDSLGNLLTSSRLIDPETGEPIVMGDGLEQQIRGGNESFSSGADGNAVVDDFIDMMKVLEKKSEMVYGKLWYVVTGTDGYGVAQNALQNYWVNNMGGRSTQGNGSTTVGGEDIPVGGNFDTFNVNGNQIIFVKHPMFDNEELFTQRGLDGTSFQSNMYYFLDMSKQNGKSNIEILGKGAYGINRTMVSSYINGMTGDSGTVLSPVDAKEHHMLKQDNIFIYNTTSCGLMYKSF